MHATHLTDDDVIALHRTATGVCFCLTTERDLGDGVGPAPALLDGPGLFSLGSNSHVVIDFFAEAQAVELDERLASGQRAIISAERLLHCATDDGQAALGWADAGRLAVGLCADFDSIGKRPVVISLTRAESAGRLYEKKTAALRFDSRLEEMRMGTDLCRIVHRPPGQLRGMP